jgi:hypothetical protein
LRRDIELTDPELAGRVVVAMGLPGIDFLIEKSKAADAILLTKKGSSINCKNGIRYFLPFSCHLLHGLSSRSC